MSKRPRVYRTEAIILRRMNLGEADRLLTLLTPAEGKVKAIAKGVRRPNSKKSGHLEPFCRSRLLLARGRNLDIITQAETIEYFPQLRGDLERLGAAAYIVELIDRFTVEEQSSEPLYNLLQAALSQLDDGADLASLARYFELRLLDLVGYRPELFQCVSCHRQIEAQDQYFSALQGGVLCPRCGQRSDEAERISLGALKVLRHYQRSSYQVASAPKVRPRVHTELDVIMESYLVYLLERKLNAPEFLRRVRQMAPQRLPAE
jgi:DNA repair protein RecO (recombination protein O)